MGKEQSKIPVQNEIQTVASTKRYPYASEDYLTTATVNFDGRSKALKATVLQPKHDQESSEKLESTHRLSSQIEQITYYKRSSIGAS